MCKAIVTGADQTREHFRDFTYIIYQLPAELGTPVSIKAWHSPRHAASATASNKACCYHLLHLPRRFQVLSSSKFLQYHFTFLCWNSSWEFVFEHPQILRILNSPAMSSHVQPPLSSRSSEFWKTRWRAKWGCWPPGWMLSRWVSMPFSAIQCLLCTRDTRVCKPKCYNMLKYAKMAKWPKHAETVLQTA